MYHQSIELEMYEQNRAPKLKHHQLKLYAAVRISNNEQFDYKHSWC